MIKNIGELERTDPWFTPGPGNYAPGINMRTQPRWRIGTGQRTNLRRSDGPGPADYTMPYSFPNGPKYSMATKSGAFDSSKYSIAPGPGNYKLQAHNSAPKYTMRIKPAIHKSDSTPGPGNYNLRSEKDHQVPSYKFGRESKDGWNLTQTKYVPGPGNYEYNADALNKSNPKFSFGKEIRGEERRSNTPGPGEYKYKEFISKEAPKISMSGKFHNEQNKATLAPGPGNYNQTNTNHYRSKSPSYTIGTAQRKGINIFMERNPGPGQYAPENKMDIYRTKKPAWKIGTGKRQPLNSVDPLLPGPGNYKIANDIGLGPKYTMVGKNDYGNKTENGVPGPGQYNEGCQSNLRKSPSWKIGTGSRDDDLKRIIREGVPGPGMYKTETKDGAPKYRFGSQKRNAYPVSSIPGPGQYHIPCSIIDVNSYTRSSSNFDEKYRYI